MVPVGNRLSWPKKNQNRRAYGVGYHLLETHYEVHQSWQHTLVALFHYLPTQAQAGSPLERLAPLPITQSVRILVHVKYTYVALRIFAIV